jgi:diaminopimelate decarboxylase
MGEPGRNISQEAQTLVCQIFLVKQQGSTRHYYINNGVYQGFGCRVFDGETMYGQPLLPAAELPERFKNETNSFMWGQTCDGCDWIHKDVMLPYMN